MKKMIIVFTMIGINAFAQVQTLSEAQLQRKYPTVLKVTKVEQSRTKNNTFKTNYGSKDYEYDKKLFYEIKGAAQGENPDWSFTVITGEPAVSRSNHPHHYYNS